MTSEPKSFGSDNHAGVHEAVLRALAEANSGHAVAYGADQWTARAVAELKREFGARGGVCFVFNGTGANVLGLGLMLRPFEAAICCECAHLNVDECGAAERVLGAKLLLVASANGKLTPELVASRLTGRRDEHRVQPRAVAITQATELGTCYTLDELRRLSEFCREQELLLYMDGARLANAAAFLGCTLADLAADVDVLSFGATKNGGLAAEAVVVMNEDLWDSVPFLRKQHMQLASKMRYLAAQFLAMLDGQLWLRNARHANAMARRLADGLGALPAVRLRQPVQTNAVFAALDRRYIEELQREWEFHVWDGDENLVRWMTAFDTSPGDVDAFLASVGRVIRSAPG